VEAISTLPDPAARVFGLALDVAPVAAQRGRAATLKPVQLTPRVSSIAVGANRLHHRVAGLEHYAHRDVQGTLGLPSNRPETRCFGLYAARGSARRLFGSPPRRPGSAPR
jgi:hypothetical protein